MSVGQSVAYYLVLMACRLVAIWPDCVLFGVFRPILTFVVYRVARYRLAVVRDNLSKSFPEKSTEELRQIERKFYRNFAELLLATINLTVTSPQKQQARLTITTDVKDIVADPRHAIIMLGHFGCWEYLPAFPMSKYGFDLVCVYRQLTNPVMDRLMRYIRGRMGGITVERRQVLRYYLQRRDKGHMLVGLISDQTPRRDPKHHWIKFLGRPTMFVRGAEFMATKYGMPVYFLGVERVSPTRYNYTLETIYDGTENVSDFEITERYVAKLEEQIRRTPDMWLWTHRRWKRRMDPISEKDYYERYPEERADEV